MLITIRRDTISILCMTILKNLENLNNLHYNKHQMGCTIHTPTIPIGTTIMNQLIQVKNGWHLPAGLENFGIKVVEYQYRSALVRVHRYHLPLVEPVMNGIGLPKIISIYGFGNPFEYSPFTIVTMAFINDIPDGD